MDAEVEEPHGMKKVREYHSQLQTQVSNLNGKITSLLREREKDFLAAYRHHMYNVQKELQEAKRSVKKAKDDLRNNDQIKKLKKERDWFRNEALRLEKLAKSQEKEIDSLQLKFDTLREDRVWFEKQLKTAKRQNKILTAELGMQLHRGTGSNNQQPPKNMIGELHDRDIPSLGPLSIEGRPAAAAAAAATAGAFATMSMEDQISDLQHVVADLKDKLRESKRRNRNLQAVVNHSTKSGEYEEVFMNCVNEVKKEAARRREKLLMSQRKSRREAGIVEHHNIQTIAHQELDELTASDKRKIVDALMNHDDLFSYLYDAIFRQGTQTPQEEGGLPRIE